MFARIAHDVAAKGKKICAAAHRDFLHDQISSALTDEGVQHGIMKGGTRYTTRQNVVVASIFTLAKRLEHFPAPDLIILDEAHHALAGSWQKVAAAFPNAYVIGVSATPCRQDGGGLGDYFDCMVEGPTTAELMAEGYLSNAVVYAPRVAPDLRGVHTRGGDYIPSELEIAVDKPAITGDAVSHYEKVANGKRAVAFCCSIRHAQDVADEFQKAGHESRCLHGKTERWEQRDTFRKFEAGQIKIITSCALIDEGLDVPAIEVAILLRPTQSLGLYLQQVGRSLRTFPGKSHTIILDHAGNVQQHGFPDEDRAWTLEKTLDRKMKSTAQTIRTCPECYAMHRPMPVCPVCGHVYQTVGRMVDHVDGELEQVTAVDPMAELERRFHILRKVAQRRKHADPQQWALSVLAAEMARTRPVKPDVQTVNGVAVGDYDELRERVEKAMKLERERHEAQLAMEV